MFEAGHLGKSWPGSPLPVLAPVPWGAMTVIGIPGLLLPRVGVLPNERIGD